MLELADLQHLIGAEHVLTGADAARYGHDWTGAYVATPLAVARPANAAEVSAILRLASGTGTQVVPVAGNTGLAGGTYAPGALMLSLERMNRIREIRPEAQVAIVEAGVVLSTLHDRVADHGLAFPVTFGARGSAMIGGILSTHAGGSNVVRYGATRGMCLGLEVVMADGEIVDLLSELRKDNTGYDLKDLFIGAEGTLGIITAAVLRLAPQPKAYATAMLAVRDVTTALGLLNRLQHETGGMVEAFEFMPGHYFEAWQARFPELRPPFATTYPANVLIEVGATAAREAAPGPDGSIPLVSHLEEALAEALETGEIVDAVIARSEAERQEMWARREAAAEVILSRNPLIQFDVALPLDRVATFIDQADAALEAGDPGATGHIVSHLGDGNVHYTVWPVTQDPDRLAAIKHEIEGIAVDLGGSFSAEHGIGKLKRAAMAERKTPAAVALMRKIKDALDPEGILNPGKVLPDR